MSAQIKISREGQQYGPYSMEDLTSHLASGAISPDDLAWTEGMEEWKPLREIVSVESCAATSAPSQPPPPPVPEVQTYMELADTAEASGNSEEAYKYFSMVLERDPKNIAAWIGKGLAAGWKSTTGLEEVATCIDKATTLGMTDRAMIERAANGAHKVAMAGFNFGLSRISDALHTHDLDYFQEQKIKYARSTLMPAIDLAIVAWDLQPSVELASDLVWMCESLLDKKVLNKESRLQYKQLTEEYDEWGRQHDPGWNKKRKSGCFVATATMGNYNHPTVVLLRTFRDECLARSTSGRRFISVYYSHSPRFSDSIRNSRLLRYISYAFILLPTACVARIALRMERKRREGN